MAAAAGMAVTAAITGTTDRLLTETEGRAGNRAAFDVLSWKFLSWNASNRRPNMRKLLIAVAAGALVVSAAPAFARHHHHYRTYQRVVIHPRVVNPAQEAWWYGSSAYPAHEVPLAAYPNPGGIGLMWAPYGWGYAER